MESNVRSKASFKGKSNEELGIKCEKVYTEFEAHVGCLRKEPSYMIGKRTRLSKGKKIVKEIEKNEGGTEWSDRRYAQEMLEQKKAARYNGTAFPDLG